MKIGIGLPASFPGVPGDTVLQWARMADAGPFSSLGVIDRIAYGNHESIVTLAAAAGATSRIRLMTTILLATVRNATILAKEAATLDSISSGRLTLGLAVGGRQDDFAAVLATFQDRGVRLEDQILTMKRIWSGAPVSKEVGPVGPPPVQARGPELLLGGAHPTALRRAGRLADGFIALPGPAEVILDRFRLVAQEWNSAGRPGRPRLVGTIYFALSPAAVPDSKAYLLDYYAFMGEMAHFITASLLTTPKAIKEAIQSFGDMGMDELVFWPSTPDLEEVQRLADAVA